MYVQRSVRVLRVDPSGIIVVLSSTELEHLHILSRAAVNCLLKRQYTIKLVAYENISRVLIKVRRKA